MRPQYLMFLKATEDGPTNRIINLDLMSTASAHTDNAEWTRVYVGTVDLTLQIPFSKFVQQVEHLIADNYRIATETEVAWHKKRMHDTEGIMKGAMEELEEMKVAIVTGSRADWNGLGMVGLELLKLNVDVKIIAIGQHAENEQHLQTIVEDGFEPKVISTNVRDDMALGCGSAAIAVAGQLIFHLGADPNMVLVLGDRFEILGAATAAALRRIPLAHIGGGDITEGSIDNKLRYAITALADLHFTTNEKSHSRVYHHVSEASDINDYLGHFQVGNPALDRIARTKITSRVGVFYDLQLSPSKHNILVAYHAATNEDDPAGGCAEMLNALEKIDDASFVVLGTNADHGSRVITELLMQFCLNKPNALMRDNLPPHLFYGILTHFDCMIGNSSAGIIETAGFGIPVVNIGDRQKGRPSADNVTNCDANFGDILLATKNALTRKPIPRDNPYGDGHSAPRIAKIMVEQMDANK